MSPPRSARANFLLHLHPERVRERTLRPETTLGLGIIALTLLALLLGSGVALMFWYVPTPRGAYSSLVDLSGGSNPTGSLLRDLHRLASDALIVVVILHMARVYLTGALGVGRRLNWLVGLGLLLATGATAFTGFLLPWDSEAFWAATVGGELLALFPLIGPLLRDLLWGDVGVGATTLLRAFALHVAAVPLLGTLLLGYHLWRIRKVGGLARPPRSEADGSRDPLIASRPALTIRELSLALLTTSALVLAALLWEAPLGLPGDPPRPLDPAKAPWFLLWVQELVSYANWLGPAVLLALLAALASAPWLERDPAAVGRWLAPGRRRRCAAFLAVLAAILAFWIIATFFRGPGWRLLL